MFAEEALILTGDKTNWERKSSHIYELYKMYCSKNRLKVTQSKYFKGELEPIIGVPFFRNASGVYIQGFLNEDKLNFLDEDYDI